MEHAHPTGLRKRAVGIEPRPREQDVVGLPFARLAAGIHRRRLLLVERTALAVGVGEGSVGAVFKRIEHLDLVLLHQEHARVAASLTLALGG